MQLASDEHVSALSVKRIAAVAGVNRSTFYKHAARPLALLEAAVRSTLAVSVQAAIEGIESRDSDAIFRATVFAVFEQVQDQSGLYRLHLGQELQLVLSDFLTAALLETRAPVFWNPFARHAVPLDATLALAAFIAAGAVAMLCAWSIQQAPDRAILDAVLDQLLPMWLDSTETVPVTVGGPSGG